MAELQSKVRKTRVLRCLFICRHNYHHSPCQGGALSQSGHMALIKYCLHHLRLPKYQNITYTTFKLAQYIRKLKMKIQLILLLFMGSMIEEDKRYLRILKTTWTKKWNTFLVIMKKKFLIYYYWWRYWWSCEARFW